MILRPRVCELAGRNDRRFCKVTGIGIGNFYVEEVGNVSGIFGYRMNTYFMPENILSSNILKKRFNFIVCTLG